MNNQIYDRHMFRKNAVFIMQTDVLMDILTVKGRV